MRASGSAAATASKSELAHGSPPGCRARRYSYGLAVVSGSSEEASRSPKGCPCHGAARASPTVRTKPKANPDQFGTPAYQLDAVPIGPGSKRSRSCSGALAGRRLRSSSIRSCLVFSSLDAPLAGLTMSVAGGQCLPAFWRGAWQLARSTAQPRRGDDHQDPSGARAGIPERSIARNVSGGAIGGRIGSREIRRLRCTARLLFLTEMVRSAPNCRSG
jgi:hypothetical protein